MLPFRCHKGHQSSKSPVFTGFFEPMQSFPLATTKPTLNDFVLAFWCNLIAFVLDYPNCIGYPNFCYHFAITVCYHFSSIRVSLFIILNFTWTFKSNYCSNVIQISGVKFKLTAAFLKSFNASSKWNDLKSESLFKVFLLVNIHRQTFRPLNTFSPISPALDNSSFSVLFFKHKQILVCYK